MRTGVMMMSLAILLGRAGEIAAEPAGARKDPSVYKTIVIDPGHGGWDKGTVSRSGTKEKDLVLGISLMCGKKIGRAMKARIVYTRTDDRYVPLPQRTEIANDAQADLFVSVHANSSPKKHIRGMEIYYLSEIPSDDDAGRTASAENRAGAAGGESYMSDLDKTLVDLVQSGYIEGSRLFAEKVTSGLAFTGKGKIRGIKHANFFVLGKVDMPAILVEVGFLSNKEESKVLQAKATQENICEGLLAGMRDFQEDWRRINSGGKTGMEVNGGSNGAH